MSSIIYLFADLHPDRRSCTKNQISQVLEYHGKLKKNKKTKQVNIIFPSTFRLKKRPYFSSPKSSEQELFSNQ